jgi:hypothetical protein
MRTAHAGSAEKEDALPHGSFKMMMQLHLPFSVRTAERLMAIARNPVLTKSDDRRTKAHGSGRPSWRSRGVVLLHRPACTFWPWRKRGMDRQPHAAPTLSALLYRGHARLPRRMQLMFVRLLARLRAEPKHPLPMHN